MPENNPTLPSFTPKRPAEPSETRRNLREVNQAASERAKNEVLKKKVKPVQEDAAPAVPEVSSEPPKRKVVKTKKVTTGSRLIFDEDTSKLEEKLGINKRKRFEEANTRVTTYIDKDQLAQLRKIKKEYNVPMTEVIYKALSIYLTT